MLEALKKIAARADLSLLSLIIGGEGMPLALEQGGLVSRFD
jgi:hypothetical protein